MKGLTPYTKFRIEWLWASGTKQSMKVPRALLENTIEAISKHSSTFDITFIGRPEFKGLYFSSRGIAIDLGENATVA